MGFLNYMKPYGAKIRHLINRVGLIFFGTIDRTISLDLADKSKEFKLWSHKNSGSYFENSKTIRKVQFGSSMMLISFW